jgi:flagellar biosynthesis/type III secretory pathway protein FliH
MAAFGSRQSGVLGVLYAEDFDDLGESLRHAAPDPVPEPEIIEPSFTRAELDAARAEARAAGRAEMERGLSATRLHMLSLLANGVAESRAGAREVSMAAAESMAKLMLTMLNLCLPALCKHHGAAELSALVKTILPALIDEAKIIVRVNTQMVPVMEAEVAALDFELAERINVLPTDAVAPGDARISWADGSVTRDAGSARRLVEDALASMGLLQREMTDA